MPQPDDRFDEGGVSADRILELLEDPVALERHYRESPEAFRRALDEARKLRPDAIVLRVWDARLAHARPTDGTPARRLGAAIVIALACGALVRVPALWLGEEWYYPRLAPSWILLALAAYFWLETRDRTRLIGGIALAALAIAFTALLPGYTDSVVMALIHLPILSWVFLGLVFTGASWRDTEPRMRFLRYNGEVLILGSLVALGGMVFSALTVALFELVAEDPAEWYFQNVGVVGAAAVPVAGTYLYDTVFRRHTGIASVLARIFAPLFLVMTGVYLVVTLIGGQNPFLDRSALITVNGLLLVVLGMTVLSIAERGQERTVGWVDSINVALVTVTIVIDLVALSAIVFRLASYGMTPNRLVVLGANVVILIHLAWIWRAYVRFVRGSIGVSGIRDAVAAYLPVYAGWAALVAFVLPFVFRFS